MWTIKALMDLSGYTSNMDATNEGPILLTVADAAQLCSISTKHMYRVLRDGTIPSVKLGKRVLVPRRALEALATDAFMDSFPTG